MMLIPIFCLNFNFVFLFHFPLLHLPFLSFYLITLFFITFIAVLTTAMSTLMPIFCLGAAECTHVLFILTDCRVGA